MRKRRRMRTITILVGSREVPQRTRVAATVRGVWAYHRYKYDGFTVTHVPTGLSLNDLCADLTGLDAHRIVCRLGRDFSKRHWRGKNIHKVPDDDRWAFLSAIAEELVR